MCRTGFLISEPVSRTLAVRDRPDLRPARSACRLNDRLTRQRGGHDRSDASMDDGYIGRLLT